jgi:hypothetical protein
MLALREPVWGGALYGPVPHSGGEGGGARSQSNNFEARVIGKPGKEFAHEGADAAARREPAEMPGVDEHGRGHPSDGNRRLDVPDGKPASAHAMRSETGPTDAEELRIAVPEILEALQRMLDRIRVGELARPHEEAGQPARIGWL